jgi:hypothetical protein
LFHGAGKSADTVKQHIGVQAKDTILVGLIESRNFAQVRHPVRPGGDGIAMIEVGPDDDAMILPLPCRIRQVGFLGNCRHEKTVEIFARFACQFLAGFFLPIR